jgi:drug/metabolite transporter (DMT)-like permease
VLRCVVAAVLFGVSAPAASELAGRVDAFALGGLLYVGAALAVLPLSLVRPPSYRALRRGGGQLAVAVIVGGAIGPVLFAAGLARTPAATASLLLNLELVATVLLAAVVFHEHVGSRVASGTALVVTGGAVLAWSSTPELRLGALLVVAACVCWGVDNCVTAGLDELAPHHITMAKGLVAGTVNLGIGLLVATVPSIGSIVAALVIGAFGYGLSITLWVAGARDLGAARAQLIFATAPFVGAVIAWMVLGESVTSAQAVAVVLAATGVAAVLNSAHLHEHHHHAVDHDHEHGHDDGHHDHVHLDVLAGRHQHPHHHGELVHSHPHVPDLHHRHQHT